MDQRFASEALSHNPGEFEKSSTRFVELMVHTFWFDGLREVVEAVLLHVLKRDLLVRSVSAFLKILGKHVGALAVG